MCAEDVDNRVQQVLGLGGGLMARGGGGGHRATGSANDVLDNGICRGV